ncbi:ATP-binding protein [Methanocalculus sp.]|uniref:AlbA family DNA-binding domain-containing protein n=1 Tax=Methanocalculus sp. TaxID=2004547 RepID=UPI0026102FBE|nr:ATP-binding protein [Methanocalculus sp.]MDG6249874.1 ATP-binding protein [Methanocalculus sp.]
MLPRNIDEIKVKDLQHLIDESFLEMKTLEYKQELPGNSDGNKKEFLSDISSFANSNGGDLIYGIREEDHYPKELVGVEVADVDEEIRRLEGMIRDGIRPRIPNISIRQIEISDDKYVFLFRIPKSWLNPHMVIYKGSSRFFARAFNGKYQLDVDQLRSAFTLSESKISRIKEFVQTRLSEILSNNYPLPMNKFPKIILHIVPLSSTELQMPDNFNVLGTTSFRPLFSLGSNPAYTADGFISYSPGQNGNPSRGYVLVFRNGVIEAVSSFISSYEKEQALQITRLEEGIIDGIKQYARIFKMLKLEPPAYIFVHLIGVKGLVRPRSDSFIDIDSIPIQKDFIALPSVELLNYEIVSDEECENLASILKLPFDALANSVGLPGSIRYDQ